MLIRDCMIRETTSVKLETPLRCVVELMARHNVEALPIVDADRHVVGCISDHSLWRLLIAGDDARLETSVKDVAGEDVPSVCADETLEAAASILFDHPWIEALPVLEKGELVGTVSRHNVVQTLAHLTVARIRSAQAAREDEERRVREPFLAGVGVVGEFNRCWNTDVPDPCIYLG